MSGLFREDGHDEFRPLAEQMRPKTLEDFQGQIDIVGPDSPIRQMISTDAISSMILWGPPGVGKTTIAKIIANSTHSAFYEISATTTGIKDIKEIIELARFNRLNGQRSIVFVDEIHRFNKAQQDTFLPHVENGNIILIGATTENPSFEVNGALLSRCKVFTLHALSKEDLVIILRNAQKRFYPELQIDDNALNMIAGINAGDARSALNTLEALVSISKGNCITEKEIERFTASKAFLYDKKGEEHYNLISALHKSMRNSDPDAALYYLARMLEAGEDPLYVARRLIRFASEDVGLADPNALVQAVSAYQAAHFNGMPECTVNLSQAVVYLSITAKSNALYLGYEAAKRDAVKTMELRVPLHLRNAETKLNEQMGYGEGYRYAHNEDRSITGMICLPDEIKDHTYYHPYENGKEKNVKAALERINRIKEEKRKEGK